MKPRTTKKRNTLNFVTAFLLVTSVWLLLPGSLSALRPGKAIDDFTLNVYSIADGLPQNSIPCLIQSRNGYLWFGTRSGLVRFDGVTPRVFNRWNTPALVNDAILSLSEDESGVLWIGTDGGGLVSMNGSDWKTYPNIQGLSDTRVRSILAASNNHLWVGTDYGFNLFKNGEFTAYTGNEGFLGNAVNAISQGGSGNTLWIGTDGAGLNLFKSGSFISYKIKESNPGDPFGTEITALLSHAAGGLWIGTENGLFYLASENSQVIPYQEDNILFRQPIRSMALDKDGNLWLGTYGSGLIQVSEPGSTRPAVLQLHTGNGFLDDYIYSILEDTDGSIWVGTYTSGLVQIQNSKFKTFSLGNGQTGNIISCVTEDPNGYLWLGTQGQGLIQVKNNQVVKIWNSQDGLPGDQVKVIYRDSRGDSWIGTANSGLARLSANGRITNFTTAQGLSSNHITAIAPVLPVLPHESALWIGTDRGLNQVEIETGKIIDISRLASVQGKNSGHPAQRHINVLLQTQGHGLLLGTKGGPVRFKDGVFQPVTGAGNKRIDSEILAIYEDAEKDLWLGTRGNGLLYLRKEKLTTYTTRDGLHDNYFFSILPVEDKNPTKASLSLWMSSYRGIFKVSLDELRNFSANKISSITPVYFDERDGMKSSECISGGQPAAYRSPGGILYYPTVKGVASFDPAAFTPSDDAPRVIIEEIIIDNEAMVPGNLGNRIVEFPRGKKIFEFYFTALSYPAPQRVKFRYKLQGFDEEWTETQPNQKRTALYINLEPGEYRFDVLACSGSGVWSAKPVSFAFNVEQPFFGSPIFYILLILVCLAGAGGFFLWKQKQKNETPKIEKYKTSALDPTRAEEILPKLLQVMEKEKLYLDGDLTLKKLSEKLMIHYNYLSQIINEKLESNFNDFVNKYRIEEAKRQLLDKESGKKTVLEIAYDTGFYSKSVFNTAFKKFTGMTPTQYRKTNQ